MDKGYLEDGLRHGFLDSDINAESDYIPKFITNNPELGEKVITSLKQEMLNCDEFMFSVAFITDDGVNSLMSEFRYLIDHNIKGKILASEYQNFTQPKALRTLLSFPNVELRIVTEERMKMHSKCYIFRKNDDYDVIIGSSNLTNNALCSNGEWNLKFNSANSGEVISNILKEFNHVFEYSTKVDEEWIDQYSKIYYSQKRLKEQVISGHHNIFEDGPNKISPNKMQTEALNNLQKIRDEGKDRALVISATGSGKTYLSAFDALKFGGRLLYIVHRKPILNKSMESFRTVFGSSKAIEKYDPARNNIDVDCLFSTNIAMAEAARNKTIPADHFDYLLIDEVHRIGAETYQTIVRYFKPKFLMGMTATPERTDDFDIYEFFNYNIAYDIRLKEAMEYKLICPFHYFGIHDILIDDQLYDDKTTFNQIEEERRVKHIIDNARFYGHCEGRLKGLVFCRGLKEAERYSTLFNANGYRTVWVSGKDNEKYVNTCIERLETDDDDRLALDYIFTADLFNEGVDIPSINQVIMLRPTESPIVYVQQLGRGLRIHKDKSYVVVLDFIGNYEKNYNIPLALADDRRYNKSEIRRFVSVGDTIIPGNSTISFDEISKRQIFETIDKAKFSEATFIYRAYSELRMKLGRIPRLTDFRKYGTIDALRIVLHPSFKSYHTFLTKREDGYDTILPPEDVTVLEYLTKIIASGKRLLEIEVAEAILNGICDPIRKIRELHPEMDQNAINNITSLFDGTFFEDKKSKPPSLIDPNGMVKDSIRRMFNGPARDQIEQLLEFGRDNYDNDYSEQYENTNLVLNKMYTYAEVCRLMNWKSNVNGQNIGGYMYNPETNTFPVFINYKKGENVKESLKYEDHFENRNTLVALSKVGDSKHSKRMTAVRDHRMNNTVIHLFVRKNNEDEGSKEFYYLGIMDFVEFMDDNVPVKIKYRLRNEVKHDLYEYFTKS